MNNKQKQSDQLLVNDAIVQHLISLAGEGLRSLLEDDCVTVRYLDVKQELFINSRSPYLADALGVGLTKTPIFAPLWRSQLFQEVTIFYNGSPLYHVRKPVEAWIKNAGKPVTWFETDSEVFVNCPDTPTADHLWRSLNFALKVKPTIGGKLATICVKNQLFAASAHVIGE